MKYIPDERGIVSITLIVLIILLVAVGGFAVYNVTKSRTTSQATPTPSVATTPTHSSTPSAPPSPLAVSADDRAAILTAASNQCNASAKTKNGATLDATPSLVGDAAKVGVHCIGYISGQVDILKKVSGAWTIVYTGQEPPSKAIGQQYSLPTAWYQAN
jgi:hypothetical protein